ncbi:MAG: DUF4296 domain-containing protein [Saprospiraceae bacterium]|nr:DUF4296 domain-containing protein [Saprospiraceae bacterium]
MKKQIATLLLCSMSLLSLVSCQPTIEAPIPSEKLVHILVDIHTAEALTESEKQEVRDSMNSIYYEQIFKQHGVTDKDLDSTMTIYARNPVQFDSIYVQVERMVKAKRSELTK